MQIKTLSLVDCALKFAPDTPGHFQGYGSVFNVKDAHRDIVMPGAYADVIKSGDPVHVYTNHGWLRGDLPIGRWSDLAEDATGLKGSAQLEMQMPAALNGYWAMKAGLVDGLSVAIATGPDDVERQPDGTRLIHRVRALKEISIVTTPANAAARVVDVKGVDILEAIESADSIRELEHLLRDAAGLSKAGAAALVARCKSLAVRGEPAQPDDATFQALQLASRLNRLASAA